ncbi:MAG: UDP-N-acetylglucosamine 1-carboxyvinyltransferase, partial [Alistipes sp.]|nr:UDP-N-acetylglucosamine 1-carboxyvinyltransferase [Alistipes sp.]
AETVLVDSFPARGLVSSLHCHSYILFIVSDIFTDCKSTTKKLSAKIFHENNSKSRAKSTKSF